MLRYLPFLLVIGLWIYSFIDCLTTPDEKIRNLPKVIWVIIILVFGGTLLLGPVAWLVAGRPRVGAVDRRPGREPQVRPEPPRFVAPDDNPEFLASLGKSLGPQQDIPDAPDDRGTPGDRPGVTDGPGAADGQHAPSGPDDPAASASGDSPTAPDDLRGGEDSSGSSPAPDRPQDGDRRAPGTNTGPDSGHEDEHRRD